ncbi:hypothetical protein ACFLZB_02280 [Nanoarchaeota archaeon]
MGKETDYRFKPRERIFCLDGERFLVDGVPFNRLEEFFTVLDSIPIKLRGDQDQYHLRYDNKTGTLEIELESFDDGEVKPDAPDDFYNLVKEAYGVLNVVRRGTLDEPMVKRIKVKKKK